MGHCWHGVSPLYLLVIINIVIIIIIISGIIIIASSAASQNPGREECCEVRHRDLLRLLLPPLTSD